MGREEMSVGMKLAGLVLAAVMASVSANVATGFAAEGKGAASAGASAPPAGTTGAPVGVAAGKAGPVADANTVNVTGQIMALRRQIQEAVARKDRAALETFYHDRFTHLRENGRADTKKERIDLLLSGQNGVELASADQALIETFSPDTAVLSGVSVIREKTKKKGETFQWLALYVRDKGQWRVALSQANRLPKPE